MTERGQLSGAMPSRTLSRITRVGAQLLAAPGVVWGAAARTALTARDRFVAAFPDRELIVRSNGQVRFLRLSGRLQRRVVLLVGGAALVWVGTVLALVVSHLFSLGGEADLLRREAAVVGAQARVARYRQGVGAVADDLRHRQDQIEQMVRDHVGDLPANLPKGTVSDSSTEAARTVKRISAEMPEAAGLARIEARQLAFVEHLTRYADDRAARVETAIRRVGLDPARVAATDAHASGGPLIALFGGGDDALDPRFARLGASLARLSAYQAALTRLPNTLPAQYQFMSSGFGYRIDPITHGGAFHPGLDFRAPVGTPVHAAASGVISFAGYRAGYGNCVEIDHGHDLVTRYAHMSRLVARVGQPVHPGTLIGAIGTTGRSTGPHLHFEVRIADRAVNPRPFLETLPHVFEESRARANPARPVAGDHPGAGHPG